MRQFVEGSDCSDVAGITRGSFEGPDAAFAENHVGIAVGDDVLGRHQQLLHCATHSTLQQYRTSAGPQLFEQNEVLHIASADLHDIGIFGYETDIAIAHYLSDNRQSSGFLGFAQQLKYVGFETLKIIWRRPGLECSAAQDFGPGTRHAFCRMHDLLFRLNRAWSGHDNELASTNLRSIYANLSSSGAKFLA